MLNVYMITAGNKYRYASFEVSTSTSNRALEIVEAMLASPEWVKMAEYEYKAYQDRSKNKDDPPARIDDFLYRLPRWTNAGWSEDGQRIPSDSLAILQVGKTAQAESVVRIKNKTEACG